MKNKPLVFYYFAIILFFANVSSFAQKEKSQIASMNVNIAQTYVDGCSMFTDPTKFSCANSFTYQAPTNNNSGYGLPTGAVTGCLYTTPNQIWFIITVNSLDNGVSTLNFTETNSNNRDVDATIWGPIQNNNVANACAATQNTPLTCDYSYQANAYLTLTNVQVGQKYVMLVTNYSNVATQISINQPTGGSVSYCMSNFTPCVSPTASISGNQTINTGNAANLSVNFTGSAPWTYNIANYGVGTTSTNPLTLSVSPTQTTTYTMTSVANACGGSNSASSAKVIVCNPNTPPTGVLSGSASIQANKPTNLTVNFTGIPPYNYNITNYGSGTTSANPLIVSVSPSQTTTYTLASMSNACGNGTVSGNAVITVLTCGTAVLDSNDVIVNYPNNANLTIRFTGTSPFSATLSDNTLVSSTTLTKTFSVTPNQNTLKTYTIVSASGACGALLKSGSTKVYSCSSIYKPYGSISNVNSETISSKDSITITVTFSGDAPYTYNIKESGLSYITVASGTTSNTTISFRLKPNLNNYNYLNPNLQYYIATLSNPCGTGIIGGGNKSVTICDKPTATLAFGDELIDLSDPNGSGHLDVTLLGNPPINVTYSDGTNSYSFNVNTPFISYTVNITQPTLFTLTGASNSCGTGTVSGQKTVRVVGQDKKLLSCFPFEGNPNDTKGGITGAINGGVVLTSDRFGRANSAYEFNGTNGYISFTNDVLNSAEFTYSMWIMPYSAASVSNSQRLLTIGGDNRLIALYTPQVGQQIINCLGRTSAQLANVVSPNIPNSTLLNKWHHISFSLTKTALKLYLDGVLIATGNNNFTPGFILNRLNYIGTSSGAGDFFKGKIDDIKIFSKALNGDEIATLYNSTDCDFEYQENRIVEQMACYTLNGNPVDNTDYKNHGTVSSASLATDRFGNSNSAYQFNGSSSYISLPMNNFQNYEYSISVWVYPLSLPSTGNSQTVIYLGNTNGEQSLSLTDTPNWRFTSNGIGTLIPSPLLAAQGVGINQWTHLMMVRTLNEDLLYVNGIQAGKQSHIAAVSYSTTPIARLGSGNNANFFNGIIDDVKVFKGALYKDEVKAIYNETVAGCNYKTCPPSLTISSPTPLIDTQSASKVLLAQNVITPTSTIKYTSGNTMLLLPGFNVDKGSVFKAEISGCPNNN